MLQSETTYKNKTKTSEAGEERKAGLGCRGQQGWWPGRVTAHRLGAEQAERSEVTRWQRTGLHVLVCVLF